MTGIIKRSLGCLNSYCKQIKRLLCWVQQVQNVLIKDKIVIKILRIPTIYAFLHKLKDIVFAPGPLIRVSHFKPFSVVSLLQTLLLQMLSLITIPPMCFSRPSKVLLFTSPQHGQTRASYSNIGLLITEFKYKYYCINFVLC